MKPGNNNGKNYVGWRKIAILKKKKITLAEIMVSEVFALTVDRKLRDEVLKKKGITVQLVMDRTGKTVSDIKSSQSTRKPTQYHKKFQSLIFCFCRLLTFKILSLLQKTQAKVHTSCLKNE